MNSWRILGRVSLDTRVTERNAYFFLDADKTPGQPVECGSREVTHDHFIIKEPVVLEIGHLDVLG